MTTPSERAAKAKLDTENLALVEKAARDVQVFAQAQLANRDKAVQLSNSPLADPDHITELQAVFDGAEANLSDLKAAAIARGTYNTLFPGDGLKPRTTNLGNLQPYSG